MIDDGDDWNRDEVTSDAGRWLLMFIRVMHDLNFEDVVELSGVTTDPADPAMRGARGPMGAQNYSINFFHCKFDTVILCGRALT